MSKVNELPGAYLPDEGVPPPEPLSLKLRTALARAKPAIKRRQPRVVRIFAFIVVFSFIGLRHSIAITSGLLPWLDAWSGRNFEKNCNPGGFPHNCFCGPRISPLFLGKKRPKSQSNSVAFARGKPPETRQRGPPE